MTTTKPTNSENVPEAELLPCPCCGSGVGFARIEFREPPPISEEDGSRPTIQHYVHCTRCQTNNNGIVHGYATQARAADAWNARTRPPAVPSLPSYVVNCQRCGAKVELFPTTTPAASGPLDAEVAFKNVRELVYQMAPNGEADSTLMLAVNQLVAALRQPATPSISAAIAEVERLRDELYWPAAKGYKPEQDEARKIDQAKIDAFNEAITAIRTLQPSTLVDKETN